MVGRPTGTKVLICPWCERQFERGREDQIFCKTECRLAWNVARRKHLVKLGLKVEANAKSAEEAG